MAKRHLMHPGDWESVFGRLQELVMANSGADDFDEIFRLVVAKLYDEVASGSRRKFRSARTPATTARAINELTARAADRWKGIFQGAATTELTDEHLAVCVQALQEHSLLDAGLEVLDGAFEFLMSHTAKASKGQYFTPRHVIECTVRMVNPSPGETVVDPACGSSGFLIHALNYVRQHNPVLDVRRYCTKNLWGFDFDRRAVQVAKALMLIAGDGNANLFQLNSLVTPDVNASLFRSGSGADYSSMTIEDVMRTRIRGFKGFDVVLTNPPFAGEIREPHILKSYALAHKRRRIERDALFLERCVRLLKPGGRLAIVLPHNKLGSGAWSYAREWFVRHMRVVCVLGLERSTFLPHTHQKAGVLLAVKRSRPLGRDFPREEVLFLVSEKSGKDSKGKILARERTSPSDPIWVRADHDLQELVDVFERFAASLGALWRKP